MESDLDCKSLRGLGLMSSELLSLKGHFSNALHAPALGGEHVVNICEFMRAETFAIHQGVLCL